MHMLPPKLTRTSYLRTPAQMRSRQALAGRLIALAALLAILQALWWLDAESSQKLANFAQLQRTRLLSFRQAAAGPTESAPSPDTTTDRDIGGDGLWAENDNDKDNSEPAYSGDLICPTCNCSEPGGYATKLLQLNTVTSDDFLNGAYSTHRLHRYIHGNLFALSQHDPADFPSSAREEQLSSHVSCPDTLFSAALAGLQPNLPTAYVFTRVAAVGGKLGAIDTRLFFLARHVRIFRAHKRNIHEQGFLDGARASDRQLLWIVAEDGRQNDPRTAQFLKESGIPHIYFSHGPTRYYGLAQWNVVLSLIGWLRSNLYGDGPVLSVDDDGLIYSKLLNKIWKLKKAIVWQVGNIPSGDGRYLEGPIVKNGKLEHWAVEWKPERTFPIDMGGFAINSSLLIPGEALEGPWHVPSHKLVPGDTSSESQFLSKIYKSREEMEYLCDNTVEEQCYYAYHNEGGHFWDE